MKLIAKASDPKRCAFAPCDQQGWLIYQGDGYRFLVCSKAHADRAAIELKKVPLEARRELWGEKAR